MQTIKATCFRQLPGKSEVEGCRGLDFRSDTNLATFSSVSICSDEGFGQDKSNVHFLVLVDVFAALDQGLEALNTTGFRNNRIYLLLVLLDVLAVIIFELLLLASRVVSASFQGLECRM